MPKMAASLEEIWTRNGQHYHHLLPMEGSWMPLQPDRVSTLPSPKFGAALGKSLLPLSILFHLSQLCSAPVRMRAIAKQEAASQMV